jgi:hypothetical protein
VTPRSLAEWDLAAILEILGKELFETEDFDFKETLPGDPAGRSRLRGTCCAFANAGGGFLVFGVANDRTLSPQDRLKGLDAALDFPEHFGNYPRLCVPSVDWTFQNPPLSLPSGRLIHVVQIPKSWKAPHAVGSADEGWRFLKRTNKGNEGMNIDEVRASFLNYYEKRLRLQLLRAELSALRDEAKNAAITDPEDADKKYSLVSFDVAVIESILADTYPLTASSPGLLAALAQLRHEVKIANNEIAFFFRVVALPRANTHTIVRRHNQSMAAKCAMIQSLCSQAMEALDQLVRPA